MKYILNATKEAMKDTIDQLNLDNIDSVKMILEKQFSILDYAMSLDLPDEVPDTSPAEKPNPVTPESDTPQTENQGDAPKGYIFRKNLNGGYLEKDNPEDNVFLPEILIREHDLHPGDRLDYDILANNRYDLKVLDTSGRTESDIVTFTHGIVIFDESIKRFVVERNMNNESIRLNDMPQRFLINTNDVQRFSIKVDDVVDIAWYKGHFERGKVSWKHYINEQPKASPTVSKRILNNKQEKPGKKKAGVKQDLKGYTITLVGLEPYWAKYRQLVAERGGECITHCSKDPEASREASFAKSDAVIVGISHTSHSASQHAIKVCKEQNVPFTSMNGFGGNTFLMEVYDKLNIQ